MLGGASARLFLRNGAALTGTCSRRLCGGRHEFSFRGFGSGFFFGKAKKKGGGKVKTVAGAPKCEAAWSSGSMGVLLLKRWPKLGFWLFRVHR